MLMCAGCPDLLQHLPHEQKRGEPNHSQGVIDSNAECGLSAHGGRVSASACGSHCGQRCLGLAAGGHIFSLSLCAELLARGLPAATCLRGVIMPTNVACLTSAAYTHLFAMHIAMFGV